MSETQILAHILAGEAMGCPTVALVAIAYLFMDGRNRTWTGWDIPTMDIWLLAYSYHWFPDPTPTARFMFSQEDTYRPAVRRLIGRSPPLAVFECDNGLKLYAY